MILTHFNQAACLIPLSSHSVPTLFLHSKQKWNWRTNVFPDLCRDGWCSRHLRFVDFWSFPLHDSTQLILDYWTSSCVILVKVLFLVPALYCGGWRFQNFLLTVSWYLHLTNLPLCGLCVYAAWGGGEGWEGGGRWGWGVFWILNLWQWIEGAVEVIHSSWWCCDAQTHLCCYQLWSLLPSSQEFLCFSCILKFLINSASLWYVSNEFPFAQAIQSWFLLFVTENNNYVFVIGEGHLITS